MIAWNLVEESKRYVTLRAEDAVISLAERERIEDAGFDFCQAEHVMSPKSQLATRWSILYVTLRKNCASPNLDALIGANA